MTWMPCACAFLATEAPTSLLGVAMIRTLTPALIMPSARVLNFWTSPCAFWMSGLRPSFSSAALRSGLSKPSQRAEEAVSGRITPTFAPLPLLPEFVFVVPPPEDVLAPHAETARARPAATAMEARLLLRIRHPFHCAVSQRMLWRTTYARHMRDRNHTGSIKS